MSGIKFQEELFRPSARIIISKLYLYSSGKPSKQAMRVIIFYKPYGVLTHFQDREGRPALKEYIDIQEVYPAGRLDMDSEGLLLLTDEGRLSHRLTSPTHKTAKTYWVQVEGLIDDEAISRLQQGVLVKGVKTRRCQVMRIPEPDLPQREKPVTLHRPSSWIRIVLTEGRKRQIRHMTAAVGFPTLRLIRVAIGPITIEGLQPGQWRELDGEEILRLQRALG